MKPKLVRYYPHQVKSFDALGNEIPSLSGPYTPALKARIDEQADHLTKHEDFLTPENIREHYGAVIKDAMNQRWKAQPEDTIGGWCVTVEAVPGTPGDGNPPIADFSSEEMAQHIAEVHNQWLASK